MDDKDINNIAKRVAASESEDPALAEVEKAIDHILFGVQTVEEQLPNAKAETKEEEAAKKKLMDLFETAINPYVADAIEALNELTGENNE